MPKPLRKPPPTSSVARFFDAGAASRALSQLPASDHESQGEQQTEEGAQPSHVQEGMRAPSGLSPRAGPEKAAGVTRDIVLSPSTDDTFTRLVELYRRSTGTRLSSSHVVRAMFRGVSKCFESLQREAADIGRLKLPGNARGREGERDRFEDTIAEAFVNGIRSAAAYRRDD